MTTNKYISFFDWVEKQSVYLCSEESFVICAFNKLSKMNFQIDKLFIVTSDKKLKPLNYDKHFIINIADSHITNPNQMSSLQYFKYDVLSKKLTFVLQQIVDEMMITSPVQTPLVD